jgi:mannuronan 5-epimerase
LTLNTGIDIKKGSTFYINFSDINWLKIISDGINQNEIDVLGSLKVDSVKITSWDPQTNDYGKPNGTHQTVHHELVTGQGIRPTIKID